MRTLILVRHSESKIDSTIPPQQWGLTKEGHRRCRLLALELAMFDPGLIVSSEEKKAFETGKSLAYILGISFTTAPGLHEHLREPGEMLSQKDWLEVISKLFRNPSQLVFGLESGNQARERFSGAIRAVMGQHPEGNVVVITHGTVMSLYYQELTGKDPFDFWCQLGLPAFYTVSWPECEVTSVAMSISNHLEKSK